MKPPNPEAIIVKLLKGRYDNLRLISAGMVGKVYSGRNVQSGERVAIKLLFWSAKTDLNRINREISIHKIVSNDPHILKLIETVYSREDNATILVTEFIEGLSTESLVESCNRGGLPDNVVAAIARQICEGLALLHQRLIIHCDIKPANILVSSDGSVRICDFGISVPRPEVPAVDSEPKTFFGTLRYAAPEHLFLKSLDFSADIYSLGMTILFMILGRPPFENVGVAHLVKHIQEGTFLEELPASTNPVWHGILKALLNIDPDGRPTAQMLSSILQNAFPSGQRNDEQIIAEFLKVTRSPTPSSSSPPIATVVTHKSDDDNSLKSDVQALASEIEKVHAAIADLTYSFSRSDVLGEVPSIDDDAIEKSFASVRARLEWSWRLSLIMTFALFSLFVTMLVLAVVFALIYEKSYWGLIFGGTSVLSLLTVVVWKPMDKMLFSTIISQQLELLQLNYRRALMGNKKDRKEAFSDVSVQLSSLLDKVSGRAK